MCVPFLFTQQLFGAGARSKVLLRQKRAGFDRIRQKDGAGHRPAPAYKTRDETGSGHYLYIIHEL